jgi:hypothetical protein
MAAAERQITVDSFNILPDDRAMKAIDTVILKRRLLPIWVADPVAFMSQRIS